LYRAQETSNTGSNLKAYNGGKNFYGDIYLVGKHLKIIKYYGT